MLPGDDPVAPLVAVPRPHLDVASVVLVRGPRHLLAGGLGRVERVRPVVRAVPQVVAVEAVVALVLPGARARGGGGAAEGVVVVPVVVVLVVGPVVPVVVLAGAVVVGVGVIGVRLLDTGGEQGRGEGREGEQSHWIPPGGRPTTLAKK